MWSDSTWRGSLGSGACTQRAAVDGGAEEKQSGIRTLLQQKRSAFQLQLKLAEERERLRKEEEAKERERQRIAAEIERKRLEAEAKRLA